MLEDAELLRRYAEDNSETAFAELVARYVDLVYSAALRQVGGDAHRAHDVSQVVFTTLARKADSLASHPVLAGWLYTATQHAAIKAVRAESRRRVREQEAHLMQETNASSDAEANWARVRPVLDEAMRELNERDREAVLLRFFAQRPFAEIARRCALTEDAARMRVERALDKLHALLARRGITSTSSALGLALADHAVTAAPIGLSAAVTATALASTPAVATSLLGFLQFMSTSKITAAVAMVAAAAMGTAVIEIRTQRSMADVNARATKETQRLSKRLGEMERQLKSEIAQTSEFPRTLSAAQPAATRQAAVSDPVAIGQNFLTNHPEMKTVLDAMTRENFETNWGSELRAMKLTSSERDLIAREVIAAADWTFSITEDGWSFGSSGTAEEANRNFEAMEQRLRQVLGPERTTQFKEQAARRPIHALLQTVAGATYDAEVPLSENQATLVTEVIMSQGGRWEKTQSGTSLRSTTADLRQVDWPAVSQRLANILSPTQLSALQAAAATAAAKQVELSTRQKFLTAPPTRTGATR